MLSLFRNFVYSPLTVRLFNQNGDNKNNKQNERKTKMKKSKLGYTLVEVCIVLGILGVIAVMVSVYVMKSKSAVDEHAKVMTEVLNSNTLDNAIDMLNEH